ncbi:hypothetical protein [Malonomonas rubra]|uniref:hypothetical protein n=1 Tax=Malonomonas rubra TaxID=57040 RepID=UPI0026EC2C19|nr:hypothetical protein [Malonomonas rubra]
MNLEIPSKKLLNIIFFGLSELDNTLKLDEPLAQRVAFRYALRPLSDDASVSYVNHRLKVARTKESPFEPDTLPLIHQLTGGGPRLINTICDNALFETYLCCVGKVNSRIIKNVAEDFGLIEMSARAKGTETDGDSETFFENLENK